MDKKEAYIVWYKDLGIEDIPIVGGKNAALGEMLSGLTPMGINVPDGFAVTAKAYRYFLEATGLNSKIEEILKGLDTKDIKNLQKRGKAIRETILKARMPQDLQDEIAAAYKQMCDRYGENTDVAVRSSATAEDLPDASFAGQQETYLNVVGTADVLLATKKCIASLFTDRAISYRVDKGFSHMDTALSVGVQKMVRSDVGQSGVAFSIDTETGFENVVVINASYGLGEMVVQGKVTPDEYMVFKPTMQKGFRSIIAKELGSKDVKMIYSGNKTKVVATDMKDRNKFALTDDEILTLSVWVTKIEEYFSKKKGHHQPMDTEWAKDGKTGELFIVQARPETVHTNADKNIYREYKLKNAPNKLLLTGTAVGKKIASGKVKIIKDAKRINDFKAGEILVTEITDPDWEPIMKIASAIVTDKGGRTSHAAIVSRELGIPCIVGTEVATKKLKTGQTITVDCSSGVVGNIFEGTIPFDVIEHRLDTIPTTKTKIMMNIGSPEEAFKVYALPVKGAGLARLEFIIMNHIRIHPNALIDYNRLCTSKEKTDKALVAEIDKLTPNYVDKKQFYVDKLAEGIAKIGAAFYPNEVIVRFSDFKTNEYRALLGGEKYEPHEENPMIGWRGASRYYDSKFKEAFSLEVAAVRKVREEFGLTNVQVMIPFCRTVDEGKKVLSVMSSCGLDRNRDKGLKIYVMCEIPSNILRADEFLEIFDGMSIGSNDLLQCTCGLDRDSSIVNKITNEKDPAVKWLISEIIKKCKEKGKYVGICGQAPSDFPDFAEFLVEQGIESMSLNPDTIITTIQMVSEKEKNLGK
jgi:pyruvate,water dikinase